MSVDSHTDTEYLANLKFYYTVAKHNVLLEPGIKTEILDKREVFPIPHAPDWCLGMISLRGKLIPVANTHKLLNSAPTNQLNWLLVLEKAPFPELAICIDQLPAQQAINDVVPAEITDSTLPSWLQSQVVIDDKAFFEADHTSLFEQLVQENEKLSGAPNAQSNTPNQDPAGNNT